MIIFNLCQSIGTTKKICDNKYLHKNGDTVQCNDSKVSGTDIMIVGYEIQNYA